MELVIGLNILALWVLGALNFLLLAGRLRQDRVRQEVDGAAFGGLSIGDALPPSLRIAPTGITVLAFMKAGCPPCIAAIEEFPELMRQYPAITFRAVLKDPIAAFPDDVWRSVAPIVDEGGEAWRALQVRHTPAFVISDSTGKATAMPSSLVDVGRLLRQLPAHLVS